MISGTEAGHSAGAIALWLWQVPRPQGTGAKGPKRDRAACSHTAFVCLEITLPEYFSKWADEVFVSPSHPREPLSHPPAQLLNSESSWASLTFFISRKSVWNWKKLPVQLVISSSWDPSQRLLSTTAGLEGKRSLSFSCSSS